MIDQDILFRGGLMLAVLFLAGIFGASLGERMEVDPKEQAEDIILELASIVSTLHQMEPGSSLEVCFGDPSGADRHSLVLPSRIGGDHYEIHLMPGLLMIKSPAFMASFELGAWFVPSLPPLVAALGPPSIYRDISVMAGGYVVSTPVDVVIVYPAFCREGEVFIFPEDLTEPPIPQGVQDLVDLIEDSGELTPGWNLEATVECSDILAYDHPKVLIRTLSPSIAAGSCPCPILLPDGFEMGPEILSRSNGSIRFYKEVVIGKNGIMSIEVGSELV
ncbi:MAG: hypothetical protein ACMUHM_00455 [Thermoplasmatota archaeon]